MGADDVLEALYPLLLRHGTPEYVRSDNGPEFAAEAVQDWLRRVGIKPIRIYPGSPWENGYNERFNGTLRREVLNAEWFTTIEQAQIVINHWLTQYNHTRPHQALNMRPPVPKNQIREIPNQWHGNWGLDKQYLKKSTKWKNGGRPWNRTRHGSPRRSYSPLPHLAARRPSAYRAERAGSDRGLPINLRSTRQLGKARIQAETRNTARRKLSVLFAALAGLWKNRPERNRPRFGVMSPGIQARDKSSGSRSS